MSRFSLIIGSIALSILLAGCGSSAPGCAEAQTKKLAKQIVGDEYVQFLENRYSSNEVDQHKDVEYKIKSIRTENYEEDVDRYECKATVNMSSTEEGNDTSVDFSIEYTSQLTAEGKQIVEVDFQESWATILRRAM